MVMEYGDGDGHVHVGMGKLWCGLRRHEGGGDGKKKRHALRIHLSGITPPCLYLFSNTHLVDMLG